MVNNYLVAAPLLQVFCGRKVILGDYHENIF